MWREWLVKTHHITSKFLKAVFHKFYLVHYWVFIWVTYFSSRVDVGYYYPDMHYIFGERYLYTSANVGSTSFTTQKMKFSFNDFFSKFEQIVSFPQMFTFTKEIIYVKFRFLSSECIVSVICLQLSTGWAFFC